MSDPDPRSAGAPEPERSRPFASARWVFAVAPVALVACHSAVLDPRGPIGQAERTILIDSLAIMLAIVVPTIIATLGFAWWYRASNKHARYLPDWAFSGRIELVVWAIPVMVIILLGGVTWIGSHELDPAKPLTSKVPPLEIEVVSLDWKWLFIYPDSQVATVNQLVVPAGVPLRFSLTSASVLNTFFIPQLGSMIYTMNGMVTRLNLHADAPGTFRGISGHYSGEGFSDMHFDVRAVPADQFSAWVNATRGAGPVLDAASYAALARQSIDVVPYTFGAVETGLFEQIVSRSVAPGPGPATEPSGATRPTLTRH
jgi:cytochrome o ubiquinol oxidase subunit II